MDQKTRDILAVLPSSRSGDRAPRVAHVVEVLVKIDPAKKPLEGESINISRTGILIELDSEAASVLQMGNEIQLEVRPDGLRFMTAVICPAKVIRIEQTSSGSKKTYVAFRFRFY